jgi:hypothetical protein
MNYYKHPDIYGLLGEDITYVEVKDGVTLRQITSGLQGCHGSKIKYQHWGLILADQKVDYDSFEEVTPISKEEFDNVWKQHLATHEAAWGEIKNKFPVGAKVVGYIEIFYPQGVIIDIGSGALGIAEYQASQESTNPEFMYPSA